MWKKVPGYEEQYLVNELGIVRSLYGRTRNGAVSQGKTKQGYRTVHLSKNGKAKRVLVHRIVATAFIPNPQCKPQVNHINGDKGDNRVTNLEWATPKENSRHRDVVLFGGRRCGGKKNISVICLDTGEIFESANEAARRSSVSGHGEAILHCVKGVDRYGLVHRTAGGKRWGLAPTSNAKEFMEENGITEHENDFVKLTLSPSGKYRLIEGTDIDEIDDSLCDVKKVLNNRKIKAYFGLNNSLPNGIESTGNVLRKKLK